MVSKSDFEKEINEMERRLPMLFGSRGIVGGQGLAAKIYLLLLLHPMKMSSLARQIYKNSNQPQLSEIINVLGRATKTRNKENTLLGAGYVRRLKPKAADKNAPELSVATREERAQFITRHTFLKHAKKSKRMLLKSDTSAIVDYVAYTLMQRGGENVQDARYVVSKRAKKLIDIIYESFSEEDKRVGVWLVMAEKVLRLVMEPEPPSDIIHGVRIDLGKNENLISVMDGKGVMSFILLLFAKQARRVKYEHSDTKKLAEIFTKASRPIIDYEEIAEALYKW